MCAADASLQEPVVTVPLAMIVFAVSQCIGLAEERYPAPVFVMWAGDVPHTCVLQN